MISISSKLRQIREKRNLSQAKMAEMMGVGQSTYSGYETGKSEPGYSEIGNLIVGLGDVSPNDLFEIGFALAEPEPSYSAVVTGALPEHVEHAYIILCEVLDLKQATPADGDRKVVARILGKAARELARGTPQEVVRQELQADADLFLRILK